MKKLIYLSIYLLFLSNLDAQQTTTIHFDKPYYFSGDYIFYSFCDSELASENITARVSFYDEVRVIESYHIKIKNGCGEGFIKTAYDSPSKMYQMVIHVFDEETFQPIDLLATSIRIYNEADISRTSLVSLPKSQEELIIADGQDVAQSDGAIELTLTIPSQLRDKVKRVSVSVRDQVLYGPHLGTSSSQNHTNLPVLVSGIPFSGRRIYKGNPDMTSKLLFALNTEQLIFDATEVGNEEVIHFQLSDFHDRQRITFMDYLENEISVEPDAPWSPLAYDQPLSIDSSIIRHLDVHREEKLINRLFEKVPVSPARDTAIKVALRMPPNYTLDVQEFDIRGTTVDIFKEIVTPLKFRNLGKGEFGGRVFYERNGLSKFYSRDPLFILGDRATMQGSYIAKFPLQDISYFKIYSLYDSLANLSPIAFGGLVYVDMVDPNYTLPEEITLPSLTLQGLQAPVVYPITPRRAQNQPSIGPLSYWNPKATHEGGSIPLRFPESDVSTTYLVEAVLHLENGRIEVIRRLVPSGI